MADRYRVRLRLSPLGVWVCRLPAYYINVKLMRRNAAAEAVFSWNPIDGRIEPRACDGCLAPTDSAWLCDDAVHFVCADCLAACRTCGRLLLPCVHARLSATSCERIAAKPLCVLEVAACRATAARLIGVSPVPVGAGDLVMLTIDSHEEQVTFDPALEFSGKLFASVIDEWHLIVGTQIAVAHAYNMLSWPGNSEMFSTGLLSLLGK